MAESMLDYISLTAGKSIDSLRMLFKALKPPFVPGQKVGVKLHWGERGHRTFLPPDMGGGGIVRWLKELGAVPFVFDTTVLKKLIFPLLD